jgi:DnaJ-class molecular chaperone
MAASDPPDDAGAPPPCSACRGTGRVVSNLGGNPHEVTCPWCEGGGRRLPAHNAQARGGVDGGNGDDGGGGPDLAA